MKDSDLRLELMQKRIEHGLSQTELANKMGVSQRSVSMWENGESVPRQTARVKMAMVFGLPRDFFLSDESDDKKETVSDEKETDNEEKEMEDVLHKVIKYYGNDTDSIVSKIMELKNRGENL